jgi:hypothetical protein
MNKKAQIGTLLDPSRIQIGKVNIGRKKKSRTHSPLLNLRHP